MECMSDDLSLYTNKQFRSSDIVIKVWNIIEDNLIYAMGIADYLLISIYIDNDSIILTCSSKYDVICSIRKTFNISHVLTVMTDLSITITIDLKINNRNNIEYKKRSFYYEKNNIEDDGSIEIECDASSCINTYEDFKLEIISAIVRELQYLIHRNILNSDISKCNIASLDAEFEVLKTYSNIKKINLNNSIDQLLDKNEICIKTSKHLKQLIKRIKHD